MSQPDHATPDRPPPTGETGAEDLRNALQLMDANTSQCSPTGTWTIVYDRETIRAARRRVESALRKLEASEPATIVRRFPIAESDRRPFLPTTEANYVSSMREVL